MAKYITKEAALNTIFSEPPEAHYPSWYAERIKALPTADVVPVVHGEWIPHDDGIITCSQCGNAESSDSYYCRYCGAKMDGC